MAIFLIFRKFSHWNFLKSAIFGIFWKFAIFWKIIFCIPWYLAIFSIWQFLENFETLNFFKNRQFWQFEIYDILQILYFLQFWCNVTLWKLIRPTRTPPFLCLYLLYHVQGDELQYVQWEIRVSDDDDDDYDDHICY